MKIYACANEFTFNTLSGWPCTKSLIALQETVVFLFSFSWSLTTEVWVKNPTALRPEPDKESRDLYSQQSTLSRKDYIFIQYHPWCMLIQNWSGLSTKCIQTVKEVVRCRGQTKGLGSTGPSQKIYQGFWEPLPLCEQSLTCNSCTQYSGQSRVAKVARMGEGPSPKSLDWDEKFKP